MREIKTLIDEAIIQKRVEELAEKILKDYEGKDFTLICILKGSAFFTVDLAKKMNKDIRIEFMKVHSYGENTVSSGEIALELEVTGNIEGKNVIVVEDIVDTGRTLSYLVEYLETKKPESVKICALLNKPERREVEIDVDYIGFDIPNKFVVGYGLDFNQDYRSLPYVGYIE